MPGLGDLLARSQAAGGMAGGMPGEPAMSPDMLPPPEEEPQAESQDIESGLSIIEAFAESVDPATGDQIREAVNQIRELASNAAPVEEAPPPGEEPLPPEMPSPEEEPMP